MEIRKVPISLLNAAPYNPRKDLQPGDPEYQKIARSIEKYGCVEPIIWNEKTGSTKGGRWLWNNGSTITSQIWDTVIYAVISFGFGLGWVHTHEGRMQLIGIIIGQYLLKACLALLDTPFFYFFTRNAERR